ncbi:MAG: beta-ketoacyl synthase N-terminal-like domain-containing protein, partial [Pseudomonadota bacterium]
DASDMSSQIAGLVPYASEGVDGGFNPDDALPPKEQKKVDKFILYGIKAADEAVADSGWKPETTEQQERTGVMIGSGIGGLQSIYETAETLIQKGPRRVSPFSVPAMLINLASGHV